MVVIAPKHALKTLNVSATESGYMSKRFEGGQVCDDAFGRLLIDFTEHG